MASVDGLKHVTSSCLDDFASIKMEFQIGTVVNAAVLVIDHAAQLIKEGMPPGEAMLTAMTVEFQPIVMIT